MEPTILIGLDGMTFTILDHLMDEGVMPYMRDFVAKGARAELLSTANPLTPPAWIALMTGRSPGNHGVFDFIWSEERGKEVYFTLYNFRDIRCETIWSMVSRQGGRACTLNFPMMAPAPEIDGFVIPGLVSWKHLRRNIHPRDVYEEIKEIPGFSARELAWDFDLEKKAAQGIPHEEYEQWVKFHIRRERQWFEVLRYLMKKEPCDLTSVLFDGVDKILHMGWRFLDPALLPTLSTDWEMTMRSLCLDYFRELDHFLAEISQWAGPEARIFMASDHGFGPSWEVFRVNTWLQSRGYLTWKQLDDLDEETRKSYERLVDKHFVLLDWDRTLAYARSTTSNGIYIRVAGGDGQSGVPADQYEAFRDKLIEQLRLITDEKTGAPIVKKILTREEAYPGKHNRLAPDLTLVMRDHSFVSILNKEPVICPRPGIEGTHYPQGIFLANGPGVHRGIKLPQQNIVDVAPCLLHSLGLDVPCDLEGGIPEGLFEDDFLMTHPVKSGAPTRPLLETSQEDTYILEAEEKAQIIKQLQALGYME